MQHLLYLSEDLMTFILLITWHITHKAWNKLCHALWGNTTPPTSRARLEIEDVTDLVSGVAFIVERAARIPQLPDDIWDTIVSYAYFVSFLDAPVEPSFLTKWYHPWQHFTAGFQDALIPPHGQTTILPPNKTARTISLLFPRYKKLAWYHPYNECAFQLPHQSCYQPKAGRGQDARVVQFQRLRAEARFSTDPCRHCACHLKGREVTVDYDYGGPRDDLLYYPVDELFIGVMYACRSCFLKDKNLIVECECTNLRHECPCDYREKVLLITEWYTEVYGDYMHEWVMSQLRKIDNDNPRFLDLAKVIKDHPIACSNMPPSLLDLPAQWHISHKAWNALMHALHGNGTSGTGTTIKRLYTEGMPHLTSLDVEDFVSWTIDYTAWAQGQGIYAGIISRGTKADGTENDPEPVIEAEGLRYLCAAIDDHSVRSIVAIKAGNSGITGYKELLRRILRGVSIQPTIQMLLEKMAYNANEGIVSFHIKYAKFCESLDPKPADQILSSKFATAICKNTGNLYIDCVTAANDLENNFDDYCDKLTTLIAKRQALTGGKRDQAEQGLHTRITALETKLKQTELQNRQLRNQRTINRKGTPNGGPDGKGKGTKNEGKKKKCGRCGKMHSGKCTLPKQECDFLLPNGKKCGGDHARKNCYYEDPSRCEDPKLRAIIERKKKAMETSSEGHKAKIQESDDDDLRGFLSCSGLCTTCTGDKDAAVNEAAMCIPCKEYPLTLAHLTATGGTLFVDSAASDTIINDHRLITEPDKHVPDHTKISTGTGEIHAQSRGPATFVVLDKNGDDHSITREVIYAPEFKVNLLSVMTEWVKYKTITEFDDRCQLKLADGTTVPFMQRDKMYELQYDTPSLHGNASTCSTPMELMHRRMGHMSDNRVCHLPETTSSPSIQKMDLKPRKKGSPLCEVCLKSSMKAAPHPDNRKDKDNSSPAHREERAGITKEYGDRIHMDLAGPLTESHGKGYKYCDIFVDEAPLHIGGYPIRAKSDHENSHVRYCSDMAEHGGMEIKHFHSDNGGEFTSTDYKKLVLHSGARQSFINARTPNENPIAEAAFYRIFCVIRALLIDSGTPHKFWPYAFKHAIWILNRCPRISRVQDKHAAKMWTTSYEKLTGRKPNMDHLRIFGCRAYSLIDKVNRKGKLGEVAHTGWHLGLAHERRGWFIYVPALDKVITSRTVRFDETIVFQDIALLPRTVNTPQPDDGEDDDDHNEPQNPPAPNPAPRPRLPPQPRVRPTATQSQGTIPGMCRTPGCTQPINHDGMCGDRPFVGQGLPSQNLRLRRPPAAHLTMTGGAYLAEYIEEEEPRNQEFDHGIYKAMLAGGSTPDDAAAFAAAAGKKKKTRTKIIRDSTGKVSSTSTVPRSFREAIKAPDSEKWKEAMEKELASHRENGTWELVPTHEAQGRKLVGSTWAYDYKRNADGTIARWKARLCAQGFSQIPGVDYSFTYSSTVRHDTIRLLFSYAAHHKMRIKGGDIKTAYLHGILDAPIYMKQAPLYEVTGPNGEPMVCKLIKSIYGLKQSGKCWEQKLGEILTELGFIQCVAEPCLWKLSDQNMTILLAVYVDDLVIAASHDNLYNDVMKKLEKRFEITNTGDLEHVLGTRINQNPKDFSIEVDQKLFIEDTLEEFLEEDGGSTRDRTTPADPNLSELTKLEDGEYIDPYYHSLIGKLIWLALVSRPDIAYVVAFLSRFASAGGSRHMKAAYKVLKYLSKTKHYKIVYAAKEKETFIKNIETYSNFNTNLMTDLTTFTDSSFGGEKPPSGYITFYHGNVVGYGAGRLPFTPLSSCEGEYIAATKSVVHTLATRETLSFIEGRQEREPTVIFCDNMAAVQLSDNDTSSKRMKHVATRIAFLREHVNDGDVLLYHIRTNGMIADIFTKVLPVAQFHYLRGLIVGA